MITAVTTLLTGCIYTLGRMAAYIAVASAIVFFGMNIQVIALGLQHYGELLLGPFLFLCGIFLLDVFQYDRIPVGDWFSGFTSGISARLAEKGYLGAFLLGVIFALSFCPFSAVLFFAMLIPLAIGAGDPLIIPAVFALATGLPGHCDLVSSCKRHRKLQGNCTDNWKSGGLDPESGWFGFHRCRDILYHNDLWKGCVLN